MLSAGNPIAMMFSVMYVRSRSNSSVTNRRFFFDTFCFRFRPVDAPVLAMPCGASAGGPLDRATSSKAASSSSAESSATLGRFPNDDRDWCCWWTGVAAAGATTSGGALSVPACRTNTLCCWMAPTQASHSSLLSAWIMYLRFASARAIEKLCGMPVTAFGSAVVRVPSSRIDPAGCASSMDR